MSSKLRTRAAVTAGLCAALTLTGAASAFANPAATESAPVSVSDAPAGAVDTWDGTVDITWYSADDSKTEYTLSSAEQLAGLAKLVNEGNSFKGTTIKLGINLNLANLEWTPIGAKGSVFAGTFDGAEHTISGLTIEDASRDYVGLFGVINTPGKIINVVIDGAAVTGKGAVGSLVGSAYTGSVERCKITGLIKIAGNYKVGGMVGEGYADLTNCSVSAASGSSVVGTYKESDLEGDNVGGLIGFRGEGKGIVTNDCSVSNLHVEGTRKVGGLIGSAFNDNVTTGCSVSNVSVASNASLEYAQGKSSSMGIGGVVGLFTSSSTADGEFSGITASNVTLSVSNQDVADADIVSCGYISGGQRGSTTPASPSESMTIKNIVLLGNNVGQSLPADLAENPAVSGTPDAEQTVVAVIGSRQFESLDDAVKGAANGDTIKLLKSIEISQTVSIEKDITIDLDENNKITGNDARVFHVKSGKLTLTGKGTVTTVIPEGGELKADSSVIRVGDNGSGNNGIAASLVIDEGIVVEAPSTYGVTVFGSNTNEKVEVKGEINSKVNPAISGNGTGIMGQTDITVSSTAKLTTKDTYAIYHPQAGTLKIDGATIEGKGGIEAKGGTITISGNAKIAATAKETSHDPYSNGPSTDGYAIAAVANKDYAGAPKFEISSATVTGKVATEVDDGATEEKKGTISITGGTYSENPSAFVSSDDYVVSESGGKWTVSEKPATPPSGGGSTVPSDKTEVEQNQDGSTTTTVTKPDGSQTITHETATGTSSTVTKDEGGNVTSTEVSVSKQGADAGKVELPIEKSEPAADAEKAPEVEVKVPFTVTADKPVQVTVPVSKEQGAEPNQGVVVYAVDAEGNETVLPKCSVDKDGNVVFEATGDVTIKVVDAAKDMPDVTDADWFAGDVVDFATARGIVNGVDTPSGKQFKGYDGTSRGMLVAMLHNLELNPEAASDATLPDIPDSAYYADAAAWALEEGILSGVDMPDGTKEFQGESAVTREQVAVFLMRYAEHLGMDVSKRAEIGFPDASEVSGFAKDAMSWAVANGLFTGNDVTGELNPTDGAARAEVAAVLMRFINLMYA